MGEVKRMKYLAGDSGWIRNQANTRQCIIQVPVRCRQKYQAVPQRKWHMP